jgi:hypothetical protein
MVFLFMKFSCMDEIVTLKGDTDEFMTTFN